METVETEAKKSISAYPLNLIEAQVDFEHAQKGDCSCEIVVIQGQNRRPFLLHL